MKNNSWKCPAEKILIICLFFLPAVKIASQENINIAFLPLISDENISSGDAINKAVEDTFLLLFSDQKNFRILVLDETLPHLKKTAGSRNIQYLLSGQIYKEEDYRLNLYLYNITEDLIVVNYSVSVERLLYLFDVCDYMAVLIAGHMIIDSEIIKSDTEKPDSGILFAGGDGSVEDPYRISEIRHLSNVNLLPDGNYILLDDMDLSGIKWTPISFFNGSFNGNGHTLSGLNLSEERFYYSGLFSVLGKDSAVHDLILQDVGLSSVQCAGTIAGLNSGTVTRCRVTGDITSSESGGIVAINERSGVVSLCSFSGTCESRNSNTGGISSNNLGIVSDCSAEGLFYAKKTNTGGISGYNSGSINRCYSTGRIVAEEYNAGGICGANAGVISECAVYDVTTSSLKIDILAVNYAGSTRNCGVLRKKNLSNVNQPFFGNWNFETVWIMTDEGPALRP